MFSFHCQETILLFQHKYFCRQQAIQKHSPILGLLMEEIWQVMMITQIFKYFKNIWALDDIYIQIFQKYLQQQNYEYYHISIVLQFHSSIVYVFVYVVVVLCSIVYSSCLGRFAPYKHKCRGMNYSNLSLFLFVCHCLSHCLCLCHLSLFVFVSVIVFLIVFASVICICLSLSLSLSFSLSLSLSFDFVCLCLCQG